MIMITDCKSSADVIHTNPDDLSSEKGNRRMQLEFLQRPVAEIEALGYRTRTIASCTIGCGLIHSFRRFIQHLDKIRFHQNGGGKVALLKVDEETLELAAFLGHQATLEAVETTTDDADTTTIDFRTYLIEAVVFHVVGRVDGIPKLLKVLVPHTHGFILLAATHIAVLQQWHLTDDRIQLLLRLMDEDKVGHVGDETHNTLPELLKHMLFERHKHAACHFGHLLQLLISGLLGVWTCQIAQHIPAVF